ncbi:MULTISPECIES: pyridoxamine 5'-phosphate oxidase family protein [unclassified Actinotalea]|uniref:pyridoxamine 5'-phosphate oxidase family protein n=1 Tax=unclassified Actinotalea TaxID=2638618 RepID=UPI0015F5CE9F|nr:MULTISPECIES: pyridoxamine 5'-phosphate oxidase family protein [unclassified Actinotalea]
MTAAPDEDLRTVRHLLEDAHVAMLTSIAPDGTLMSRPMGMQAVDFDGDLWFFAERSSRLVAHVTVHPQVNVAVAAGSSWVSLTGRARVVEDDAKKRQLWNAVVEAWLPQGPDDPEAVLLHVAADSAEYWDSPGRVATLISFVKAKVTGERYDGGENERVEL